MYWMGRERAKDTDTQTYAQTHTWIHTDTHTYINTLYLIVFLAFLNEILIVELKLCLCVLVPAQVNKIRRNLFMIRSVTFKREGRKETQKYRKVTATIVCTYRHTHRTFKASRKQLTILYIYMHLCKESPKHLCNRIMY